MDTAPLYEDVADGPDGGQGYWLTTDDGLRIRVGVWSGGDKGTVLIFPGRTEYVEKYGRAAHALVKRGYNAISIDWRGQGLGQRMLPDRALGHVERFTDYQKDVRAVLGAVDTLGLAKPLFLLAHSMGGGIGLRSLMEGVAFEAAIFTGPMWGISLPAWRRTAGWTLSTLSRHAGFDTLLTPGTIREAYVDANPFPANTLTTDPDMYAYMQHQVRTYPDLSLGGPTYAWVNEALKECRTLSLRPTPNVPVCTFLGSGEKIVDAKAIHDRMARWPGGELVLVEGAEHEVIMEGGETQDRLFDRAADLFTRG
ncbi:MAG: alpha/beta hydrolase [Litoreibacter sp.]|nr:alpha/beta hydrolase [Litoreibacter sp.]